jgi:hypothetical protein
MNWDAIGAVGETVGAAAVFLTLAYLALQIRQNTKATQASAVNSSITEVNRVRQALFESEEVVVIYESGMADPQKLSKTERTRFRLIMHTVLLSEANIHSQAVFAKLSESTWDTQRHVLTRIVATPGGRWFWRNYGREFEKSFRQEVENILSKN